MAITKLDSSRDFLRIWFFWKKQAITLIFLIIGVVMFYAYTTIPKYKSVAEILILPKTNEGEVISSGTNDKQVMPVTIKDIITEIELLKSNSVLEETVTSFGTTGMELHEPQKGLITTIVSAANSAIGGILKLLRLTSSPVPRRNSEISLLKGSISATPVIDSSVITVSLQAEKQESATMVLTKLLSVYMKHRGNVFSQPKGQQFYAEQAANYKTKLSEAEEELKKFQQQSSIVNLQSQNQANIDLLTKLDSDLKLLEIDYTSGIKKINLLKKLGINSESLRLHLTKEMRVIPVIVELEKGIVPLLIKRSQISTTFTSESREYKAINGQVAMLRDEIRLEILKAIETDELELASKKIKADALRDKIVSLQDAANKFSQHEKKYKELTRQVELYSDSYLVYSQKTENSSMFAKKTQQDLTNVSISSPPSAPGNQISPDRLQLLFLAIITGLLAALFAPFILETVDNKIKTADDVEVLLGLPVICNFNEIK